jgi:glutathione S-transferase
MLTLYGFPVSNYFNMVKLALLEKNVPFEIVTTYPNQTDDYLALSPRGKVPCLQTERGFISETDAILDYIEETQPGPALLPSDPFARAQVRALMKEIELYVELPARLGYPEAFFGANLPEAILARAKSELLLGIAAVKRRAQFAPYIAGESFTLADIYFLYTIENAAAVARQLFDVDLLGALPGAADLLARLQEMPNVIALAADKAEAFGPFMAWVKQPR